MTWAIWRLVNTVSMPLTYKSISFPANLAHHSCPPSINHTFHRYRIISMSDPTEHPPSPIPVPWPFHPPYDLEPSHPLYNHVPRKREQQADVQARWDIDWAEFDRQYQSTRRRAEQTRQRTEVPKPTAYPETNIYGFAPGDPMYRPHLRYTPREFGDEGVQRGQAAMPPGDNRLPRRTTGPPGMAPSQSGNGYGASQSMRRPPSPPPIPYRPTDMCRDLDYVGFGHPGPGRPVQQDRYQEHRYPIQRRDAGTSTGHRHPPGGSQGYVNLTLRDEHLVIWDWSED